MSQATLKRPKTYMIDHPVTVEPTERWVRAEFAGEMIADSKRAMLLLAYGPGILPGYFFTAEDIRTDLLRPSDLQRGGDPMHKLDPTVAYWDVVVGDRVAESAAWSYKNPPADRAELKDLYTLTWSKMDHWYEEEEEVFVHARDPHKRVDVMRSSRKVRVEIDGVVVAESERPTLLFETHLPLRFYLPPEDVKTALLTPTDTVTRCPYKGVASYWTANINGREYKDIVWSYKDPIPENPKIAGLMCFLNEKVDIEVDGERLERPLTPFA